MPKPRTTTEFQALWPQLALRLAKDTGDEKLAQLVELAIATDSAPWIVRGSRPLSSDERWEARGDRWARVWAHLAGLNVLVMGTRPRIGGAWITAQIATSPGAHFTSSEVAITWEVVPRGATALVSEASAPWRKQLRGAARRLAGTGWSEVAWGLFGSRTPNRTSRLRLPPVGAAAQRALDQQVRAALNDAHAEILRTVRARSRGPRRRRLDQHLPQLVVYLRHHGHGALRPHGWRKAAQALFDLPQPIQTDDDENSSKARAVRRHYEAAQRCIDLARALGRPRKS